MKKTIAIFLLLAAIKASPQLITQPQPVTHQQYKEDFAFFWETVNDNYCYFEKKQIDWDKLKEGYGRQIDTVTCRESLHLHP